MTKSIMTRTPLYLPTNPLPERVADIPGVWPSKYGTGGRVPLNVSSYMGWKTAPFVDGEQILENLLGLTCIHPWVKDMLMDHQRSALVRGLGRTGFSMWSPPGSGKTLCGILWALGGGKNTKLVITKAAARGTWKEEIRKYTRLTPIVLKGEKPDLTCISPNAIYITAWETLIHWADVLESMQPHSLVMDEIHWAKNNKRQDMTIDERGIKRWKYKNNAAAAAYRISQVARRRFGLTATPIPNRPRDLWAQLDLVEPWQWGTFHEFGVRYCEGLKATYGWKYDGLSNQDELLGRLRWSKHKTDQQSISENLPPKRRQVVYLDQDEQNAPSGKAWVKKGIKRAGGDRESVFEVLLREAASRKRKYVLDRAMEAVSCGQKVVIFTGRREDCDRLGKEAQKRIAKEHPDVSSWCAHGGTSADKRDSIRHEYMEASGGSLLVGTGDAWGESVNLQDTDLVLLVMLPWTPRAIRQWEGRFCRLGQERPVLISYIIASGTVDEHVADLLIDKLPAVASVVDDQAIMEVEAAFSDTKEDLLSRVAGIDKVDIAS